MRDAPYFMKLVPFRCEFVGHDVLCVKDGHLRINSGKITLDRYHYIRQVPDIGVDGVSSLRRGGGSKFLLSLDGISVTRVTFTVWRRRHVSGKG